MTENQDFNPDEWKIQQVIYYKWKKTGLLDGCVAENFCYLSLENQRLYNEKIYPWGNPNNDYRSCWAKRISIPLIRWVFDRLPNLVGTLNDLPFSLEFDVPEMENRSANKIDDEHDQTCKIVEIISNALKTIAADEYEINFSHLEFNKTFDKVAVKYAIRLK